MMTNALLAAPVGELLGDQVLLGRLLAVSLTLVLASMGYVMARRALGRFLQHRGSDRFLAQRLLGWLYVPIVGLIVLQGLGVDLGHVWTLVSALMAMVAVGFVAAWSLLSNLSAAFLIMSTRLFSVGDEVEILEPTGGEGLRGNVVDLQLLFTTIEQVTAGGKGRIVTRVPNNAFFQKAVRIRYDGAELPPATDAQGTGAAATTGSASSTGSLASPASAGGPGS